MERQGVAGAVADLRVRSYADGPGGDPGGRWCRRSPSRGRAVRVRPFSLTSPTGTDVPKVGRRAVFQQLINGKFCCWRSWQELKILYLQSQESPELDADYA